MDSGQFVYIISRLSLGAIAAFLAILLWTKTRDTAWMLIITGVVTAYAETVYSVLALLGIPGNIFPFAVTTPAVSIILTCLPVVFFIAAFTVMILRKFRGSQ